MEYPINVGAHPLTRAFGPSSARVTLNPLKTPTYFLGSTCILHLTKSKGVTNVCVIPQDNVPKIYQYMVELVITFPFKIIMRTFE